LTRLNEVGVNVGKPVYFAGGSSVGRCKVRTREVEIDSLWFRNEGRPNLLGVGLACVQAVYSGFGLGAVNLIF